MSHSSCRLLAVLLALVLVAASCSSGDSDGGAGSDDGADGGDAAAAVEVDYEAIGLWDDGPCDESLEPLKIGLMTIFESPVLSLEDQATALEASAEAFNSRGGANGACIQVTTCDDGGNADQALDCVREVDDAGVVATVNDQGTAGQADVSAAMAEAGIPGSPPTSCPTTGAIRTPTRWTPPAPGSPSCSPKRSSRRTSRHRPHPRRPRGGLRARRPARRPVRRRRRHVPL